MGLIPSLGDIDPWGILILIPVFAILMVIDLPLFALKVKNLKWADNKIQFIFVALVLAVIGSVWYLSLAEGPNLYSLLTAFPIIVVLYLLLSIINNAISKSR